MKRRQFMRGASAAALVGLSGCAAQQGPQAAVAPQAPPQPVSVPTRIAALYGPAPNERFPIPAVDVSKVPEKFWRRRVSYASPYPPGTVVVDTTTFHLHLVEPNGSAMRYGCSLGKAGFEWSGRGEIAWKRPWPTWTPPDDMIARNPELERWSVRNGGMPPGLDNPLGARALYIHQGGVDTLYRVHGTPDNYSIGRAVSSGCVRMINQDVMDLYERVQPGARIVVL